MKALENVSYDMISQYCKKKGLDGDRVYGAMWLTNPDMRQSVGVPEEEYVIEFRDKHNKHIEVFVKPNARADKLRIKFIGIEGVNIDRNEAEN